MQRPNKGGVADGDSAGTAEQNAKHRPDFADVPPEPALQECG